MNEYKIQLESKEDLIFLKQEFSNFIDSNVDSASTVSDNLRQQVRLRFGAIFVLTLMSRALFSSLSVSFQLSPKMFKLTALTGPKRPKRTAPWRL